MEMTFSHIHIHRPLWQTWLTLATIFYVIWCLWWRCRRGNPALLASVPMLIGFVMSWVGLVRVIRGAAISGGGRASMSAGLAEALFMIFFGAGLSAFLALVAAVVLRRERGARVVQVYVLLVGCILIAVLVWRQVEAYRHIAMTG